VKLLFDANLSPRLAALLRDAFPGSVHVSEVGNLEADDLSIWNRARDNGFTIVSKDATSIT
jgi:predicted nuclease of predicted toxin-antitoxin system